VYDAALVAQAEVGCKDGAAGRRTSTPSHRGASSIYATAGTSSLPDRTCRALGRLSSSRRHGTRDVAASTRRGRGYDARVCEPRLVRPRRFRLPRASPHGLYDLRVAACRPGARAATSGATPDVRGSETAMRPEHLALLPEEWWPRRAGPSCDVGHSRSVRG
jgi:hypothetical protein